jgi:hypothetical protein
VGKITLTSAPGRDPNRMAEPPMLSASSETRATRPDGAEFTAFPRMHELRFALSGAGSLKEP